VTDTGETTFRWGIIGTGWIAHDFARDLSRLPGHVVHAVGSRREETGRAFAEEFHAPRAYASYEELAADPDIDAVYVATPHPAHHDSARLCLEAGKPTLVEKPFTLNAPEAEDLVTLARERGVFLMEAMWTRFLPHIAKVREIVASGRLGDIRVVQADHGQGFPKDPTHRLYAPELGGGALLDLGIYPVSFCSLLLGTPSRVVAAGTSAFTGVDATTTVFLEHAEGRVGVATTSLEARTPTWASVSGTEGRLEIPGMFFTPTDFWLVDAEGRRERVVVPYEGHGLREEAAEVARCLADGLTESPLLPLDETVAIMRTLDEIRRQIGLTYPSEA